MIDRRRFRLGVLAAAALAALLTAGPSSLDRLWSLAVGAAVLCACVYLGAGLSATALAVCGVVAQLFAGNSTLIDMPIGPDRVFWSLALLALVREWWTSGHDARVAIVWKPAHFVLMATAVYVVVSAMAADTLRSSTAMFAALDRIAIPFLLFALAPLLFRTARQRNVLLVAFVAVGAYLGLTAVFEIFGPKALVFPKYIADADLGAHYGRARGPFLEAAGNGLVLFQCGAGAAVAAYVWRRRAARRFAAVIAAICMLGTFLTLTRAVWIGTLVGAGAAMVVTPRLRRLIPNAAVFGVGGLAVLFFLVPTLSERSYTRATDRGPIWDRINTNDAAVRIVRQRPLTGIGWYRFATDGPDYLRQRDDIPMTGKGIEIHNVFLARAAELGLVGLALFLAALALVTGDALLSRAPPDVQPWRVGFLAVSLCWLALANSTPLSYPMANALFWLWAGIVVAPRYVRVTPDALPDATATASVAR